MKALSLPILRCLEAVEAEYDSFRTFDRSNLFQVSVCRPLRPNRNLNMPGKHGGSYLVR